MWRSLFSLIACLCLLGGCRQEPRTEDFGEVIYEIPKVPETQEPGASSDRQ